MDQQKVSTNAVVALVLSIIAIFASFVVIGIFFAIPAVIYGHLAFTEIRNSNRRVGGEGMAIGGLIVGYTSIVLSIVVAMVASLVIWLTYRESRSGIADGDSQELVDDIDTVGADCAYTQVLAQLSMGRQDFAETLLDTACTTYPDDQRLLFAKAVCAHSRFSKRLSTHMMTEVARMDPESVEGRCAKAVINLEADKDVTRNFGELSSVLEQSPTNPLVLWTVGIECRTLGRTGSGTNYSAKGAECYRKLLEQWETGPVLVHQTYANILSEELGQHEEALPHRRLAVQLEPKGWTYQGLGNTLMNLKRHDEANVAFAKCVELSPRDSQYWRSWALNLYFQGNYNESIIKCQRATELDPNESEAWSIWGDALGALGRFEEAIAKYEKHLRIHPDNQRCLKRVAGLRAQLNSIKTEPQRQLESLINTDPQSIRQIDVYRRFTTNSFLTIKNQDEIEAFCGVCKGLGLYTNTLELSNGELCDIVITRNNGGKDGMVVTTDVRDNMMLVRLPRFESERSRSPNMNTRFYGAELTAWLRKRIPPPPQFGPPTWTPGETNPSTTQVHH